MNSDTERKTRIAARFGAAVSRYADASEVQQRAAAELAQRVLALPLPPNPRVLEIGCGTGHLTRRLQSRLSGTWYVTDISAQMVRECARHSQPAYYSVMDGEHPAFCPRSFDLIVSNFAVQWFCDLHGALAEWGELLTAGGHIALATLGCHSFAEWRDAHRCAGLCAATHDYPDAERLERLFPEGHVTQVTARRLVQVFDEPIDFVRGLRTIGADTPRAGSTPLRSGQMRRVLRKLADADGSAHVTYEVLYAVSRKGGARIS